MHEVERLLFPMSLNSVLFFCADLGGRKWKFHLDFSIFAGHQQLAWYFSSIRAVEYFMS